MKTRTLLLLHTRNSLILKIGIITVKVWKKNFQTKEHKEKVDVTVVISQKLDLKPKLIKRYKDISYSSKEASTKITFHSIFIPQTQWLPHF